MTDWILVVFVFTSLLGFVVGSKLASNVWSGKSSSPTRKEHKGNLYWVIEDGDRGKLRHVNECFED